MNSRDRAWEVVTEATNSDANCANDLSAIECQNCLALRIERALDAAAAAARAEERKYIRSLVKVLRETVCDGGKSEDERRSVCDTCDVIDAAIQHHAARNEVKP